LITTAPKVELRLGAWGDVLVDVDMVDALICDPPYSPRTHKGHDSGVKQAKTTKNHAEADRANLIYEALDGALVRNFVEMWSPRVRGWMVVMTDHTSIPWYQEAFEKAGRYSFAPVPFVEVGGRVRLTGDGPSSWAVYIMVARPRCEPWSKWGTLPGAYVLPKGQKGIRPVTGGKPIWVMQELVKHYSKPGDLIVDPCSGGATTLIAAANEYRLGLGAERDEKTFRVASRRIDEYAKRADYIAQSWRKRHPDQIPDDERDLTDVEKT